MSLPTTLTAVGDKTSRFHPKHQTTFTHTANWRIPGSSSKRPTHPPTDTPSTPNTGPDDPSRDCQMVERSTLITRHRERVASECPASWGPIPRLAAPDYAERVETL